MNTFRSILALFGACCAISLSAQPGLSDTVDLKISSSELLQKDTITITDTVYVTIRDTVYVNVPAQPSRRDLNRQKDFISRTPVFAARTNALAIPLLNAGVEVPINRNWSVGANYYYPWIWRGKNRKSCNQLLAFDVEGHYWFMNEDLPETSRLLGHSVGAYIGGGYYDFERNWAGHQGSFLNVGVDYKYAMPLFSGLIHLEFEFGLGYIYSKAQPYKYIECIFYLDRGRHKNIHWVGPTRAQVSVVVPIFITKDQWKGFCNKVQGLFKREN